MSDSPRILVVEDEPDMAMGLRDNLQFEGYEVLLAHDGEVGLELALKEQPVLVLLDVMMPGLDGFEVCRRLRENQFRSPILMLTARGQEIDKVRGLELGADDYITKPFGVRELLARIKAALRRNAMIREDPASLTEIQIGSALVSFEHNLITRGRKKHPLGHYESEILRCMIEKEGQVIDRATLLREIWGLENEPMNRSVDNHIVSLRRKLEKDPSHPEHIITVHGFGYKLVRGAG